MTINTAAARTPGPWVVLGAQGTAIWAGNQMLASMVKSRSDHRQARADGTFIVQACNAHDELVAALRAAQAHIGCAVSQIAPSDDKIIADHMREADEIMRAALAKVSA